MACADRAVGEDGGGDIDGFLDFADAGEKNEAIAVGFGDRGFDGVDEGGNIDGEAFVGPDRGVADSERMDRRVDFEDAAGGKELFDGIGIDRRAHDGDSEIVAAGFLESANHGECQVVFERSFVEFVENDVRDVFEEGIAAQVPEQDSGCDEDQAGIFGRLFVEADVIADGAAQGFVIFGGDAFGGGDACDAFGLDA